MNAESQHIQTDAMADDNSWYIPSQDLIQTGTGGVDDAEDPEVVWHEDGHATQDAQVPGFGQSEQAGAIGEGFGDYMAVTMGQKFGKDTKPHADHLRHGLGLHVVHPAAQALPAHDGHRQDVPR